MVKQFKNLIQNKILETISSQLKKILNLKTNIYADNNKQHSQL